MWDECLHRVQAVGEDKYLISLEMFQVREKERERAARNCLGGKGHLLSSQGIPEGQLGE